MLAINKTGCLNLQAFKKTFVYKSIPNMIEITRPLKKLGILYFSYVQLAPDNKLTVLFNSEGNAINGSQNSLINEPSLSIKRIVKPGFYFPFQIKEYSESCKKHIRNCLRIVGCADACQIIKDDEKNIRHIYHFEYNNNSLIKNEYFEAFCHYFHDKADYLIKNAERITIPSKLQIKYNVTPIQQDNYIGNEQVQEFLKEINFYNYKLMLLAKKYFLSKRQIQVLDLILHNKITKQIAHALNLSPRTIEAYINNLKVKLKCKTKFEVVLKLLEL